MTHRLAANLSPRRPPGRRRAPRRPRATTAKLAILETAERLLERPAPRRDLGRRPGQGRRHLAPDVLLLLRRPRTRPADAARTGDLRGGRSPRRRSSQNPPDGPQRVLASRHQRVLSSVPRTAGSWSAGDRRARTPTPRCASCGRPSCSVHRSHHRRSSRPLRDRGEAPDNLPAHDLATSLNLMNEAVMTASFAGQQPCAAGRSRDGQPGHIWMNGIYADTP